MLQLKFALIAICTALTAFGASAGEDINGTFGTWSGPCDAWGTPATCTSVWQQGKHVSHVVQDYAITRAEDGAQIFAGRGLYRIVDGQVDGIWEDSRGAILPLAGQFEDGTLTVIWGEAKDEIGRSVYTFTPSTMQARDSVLTDAGWRDFMAIEYARSERVDAGCAD